MTPVQQAAIVDTLRRAFKGRAVCVWDGDPEAFPFNHGVLIRLSVTSDVERTGGGEEITRILEGGKLRVQVVQRRAATVSARLEATDPQKWALAEMERVAVKLRRPDYREQLSAGGLELVGTNSISDLDFKVGSRKLSASVLEMKFFYARVDDGRDELGDDYVDTVYVGSNLTSTIKVGPVT